MSASDAISLVTGLPSAIDTCMKAYKSVHSRRQMPDELRDAMSQLGVAGLELNIWYKARAASGSTFDSEAEAELACLTEDIRERLVEVQTRIRVLSGETVDPSAEAGPAEKESRFRKLHFGKKEAKGTVGYVIKERDALQSGVLTIVTSARSLIDRFPAPTEEVKKASAETSRAMDNDLKTLITSQDSPQFQALIDAIEEQKKTQLVEVTKNTAGNIGGDVSVQAQAAREAKVTSSTVKVNDNTFGDVAGSFSVGSTYQ